MTTAREDLMLAYVYDELSDEDKASFETLLDEDADLRAEVDGLLATRQLLDEDMAFGQESGLDLPPAHLADAILRAEALARPAALREAVVEHAQVRRDGPSSSTKGWAPKLMTWLLGGSVALGGAAAAVFFLVADAEHATEAPAVARATPEMADGAPAGADRSARGAAQEKAFAFDGDDDDRANAEAEADLDQVAAVEESVDKAGSRRPADKKDAKAEDPGDGYVQGLEQNAHGRAYPTAPPPPADTPKAEPAPEQKKVQVTAAPAKSGNVYQRDDLEPPGVMVGEDAAEGGSTGRIADMDNAMGAGGGFALGREQQRTDRRKDAAPAPEPIAERKTKPKTKSAKRRARAVPPAQSFGSTVSKGDVVKGPQRLSKKEREFLQGAGKKKAQDARLDDEAELRKLEMERDSFQAEITLAGANRAFRTKHYRDAARMYRQAREEDRAAGRLGLLAHIGEVQALHKLGRHQEALKVFGLVQRGGANETSADAYLAAAQSAEALQDFARAEMLYRDVAAVKSKNQVAKRALVRVQRQRKARAETSYEAEAAADEAPAEAPAADSKE